MLPVWNLFTDKLIAKEDASLYNFINQGCLGVDGMDDKEEMRITDVRKKKSPNPACWVFLPPPAWPCSMHIAYSLAENQSVFQQLCRSTLHSPCIFLNIEPKNHQLFPSICVLSSCHLQYLSSLSLSASFSAELLVNCVHACFMVKMLSTFLPLSSWRLVGIFFHNLWP